MTGRTHRGELLRIWHRLQAREGDLLETELAELFGFAPSVKKSIEPQPIPERPKPFPEEAATEPTEPLGPTPVSDLEPIPFWQPVEAIFHKDVSGSDLYVPFSEETLFQNSDRQRALAHVGLISWARLHAPLFQQTNTRRRRSQIDVDSLLSAWAKGKPLKDIPRLDRRIWPHRLLVLVDRSAYLRPIYEDQVELIRCLLRIIPRRCLQVRVLAHGPEGPARDPATGELGSLHPAGHVVLALSDLGFMAGREDQWAWRRLARRLLQGGALRLSGLVAAPHRAWRRAQTRMWEAYPWDAADAQVESKFYSRSTATAKDATDKDDQETKESADRTVDFLLSALAPVPRIEPQLLRAARKILPPTAVDLGSEIGAWNRSGVQVDAGGITLPGPLGVRLRNAWVQIPREQRRKLVTLYQEAHAHLPEELWHMCVLRMAAADPAFIAQDRAADLEQAREFMRSSAATLVDSSRSALTRQAFGNFFERSEVVAPDTLAAHRELGLIWKVLHQEESVKHIPASVNLRDYAALMGSSSVYRLQVAQTRFGLQVKAKHASGTKEPLQSNESPIVELESSQPEITAGETGFARNALEVVDVFPERPDWASDYGEDRFGVWASLELGGVEERLRWIPPGRFLMSSPEDERGRFDNEGPQHLVRISRGFWLSEYPCRQSLWAALMGKNPSRFKDPARPVEQVSWVDCMKFMTKLNDRFGYEAESAFRFPSEAEWEYACRAGTTTASYAPDPDKIAWYSKNLTERTGLEWGTCPVGQKDPNAWGLYDMLGNVYEWCLDGTRDYTSETETDPFGETAEDSHRVVRGGSFRSRAHGVRAASRGTWRREGRWDNIGFRLARGPMLREARERHQSGGSGTRAKLLVEPSAKPKSSDLEQWPLPVDSTTDLTPRSLWLRSDRMNVRLEALKRPTWASALGRDSFGLWASLEVGGIEERLRWIPPGRFLMGSPEDELGRFDNEGPQHVVQISRGFWLSEYPCRQSLWTALMGENPSRFSGPDRPLEWVSWDECREFITKLNDRFDHEDENLFRFPSEAEWEYACRAGTTTASYARAPDPIAWYSENLTKGIGKGMERGTRPVGRKDPNGWGLYDMVGNVYEWCLDGRRDCASETETDPLGETTGGSRRVLRGGSWRSVAHEVRAASRITSPRHERNDRFGFRLARGPMLSGKFYHAEHEVELPSSRRRRRRRRGNS